jgi:hypothetical protein
LNPNAEVTLEVAHPKHFRLSAKVVWCQYQPSSSHVLTEESFPYRLGIALLWRDPGLEEKFNKYCAELEDLYVNNKALFLTEVFAAQAEATATLVETAPANDPEEVPPPTESDEAGAPSDEKVAAEMAAAAAAEVATEALQQANPEAPGAAAAATGTPETSAADVLNALKDSDPGAGSGASPEASGTPPVAAETATVPPTDKAEGTEVKTEENSEDKKAA